MEKSRDWLGKKVEKLKQTFLSESGWMQNEEQRFLIKNGGALLEEHISSCKGICRCNPILSFSAKQVLEATNNFQADKELQGARDFYCKWYKGHLDDRLVLIKKYEFTDRKEAFRDLAYRDIVISSQMSSNKNVLKLVGCCLEFLDPVLVYENAENGPLNMTGGIAFNGLSLSWKTRLNVAKNIASAITYLHTAFPRPVIHRDIKPKNIFLDKDYNPKLSNFPLSITIPEGKTHVEDEICGTLGFVDPNYLETSLVTEHTDVYSFGVFLLVLLTGQGAINNYRSEEEPHICHSVFNLIEKESISEIADPKILQEEGGTNEDLQRQLKAFLQVALRCIKLNTEDRPLMLDVAKQLVQIERVKH